jgi:hypothetical protein
MCKATNDKPEAGMKYERIAKIRKNSVDTERAIRFARRLEAAGEVDIKEHPDCYMVGIKNEISGAAAYLSSGNGLAVKFVR